MQNLLDYINEYYAPKDHTSFGAKKVFADANGKSQQRVTNMLTPGDFVVEDHCLYRETDAVFIKRDGINYVRCCELTGQLK